MKERTVNYTILWYKFHYYLFLHGSEPLLNS